MLLTVWSSNIGSNGIENTDKLRVFGIVTFREENWPLFKRLAEGVTNQQQLDSNVSSVQGIFVQVSLEYNHIYIYIDIFPDSFIDI